MPGWVTPQVNTQGDSHSIATVNELKEAALMSVDKFPIRKLKQMRP